MSYLHHRQLLAIEPCNDAATAAPESLAPLALLAELLRLWAWSGLIALLLFEPLRGTDPVLGWLPFWILGWPLCSQLLLRLHLRLGAGLERRLPAPR